jgi:hypothetical protein
VGPRGTLNVVVRRRNSLPRLSRVSILSPAHILTTILAELLQYGKFK